MDNNLFFNNIPKFVTEITGYESKKIPEKQREMETYTVIVVNFYEHEIQLFRVTKGN